MNIIFDNKRKSYSTEFEVAPDEHNPADFLTKWLAGPKLARSLAYATNSGAWVEPSQKFSPSHKSQAPAEV